MLLTIFHCDFFQEFKLNPGAKLFSPSVVHPMIVTTALPTAPNMVYIPNSSLPTTTIQPERGFTTFASRPSAPVKVAQYNNFTAGNGGSGYQFSQPVCINKFTDILSHVCPCMSMCI